MIAFCEGPLVEIVEVQFILPQHCSYEGVEGRGKYIQTE